MAASGLWNLPGTDVASNRRRPRRFLEWNLDQSRRRFARYPAIPQDGDAYSSSFDSAALQVAGIPFTDVQYAAGALRFRLQGDATKTDFTGVLKGDVLKGTFAEGGVAGSFDLKRKAEDAKPEEREVAFVNGAVSLLGTVILPRDKGRRPAVLFLHGSGPEGRWASRYLAYKFAEGGPCVLPGLRGLQS